MCVWACTFPLESVLLAMIHSQFVYSLYPSFSPPPFLPHISPFLYQAEKRKTKDQQNEMYKWQLCWCKGTQAGGPNVWSHTFAQLKSLGWSEKFANSLTGSLWYHNGCMWRGWWDSKGSLKLEVAAVDPHRRLLYRLTWMYPSPYAPIACPSMPSSFISLSFSSSIIQFFTFPGGVSFWVIWRK